LTPQQELKWLHEALGNVAASAERDGPEDDAAEAEGACAAAVCMRAPPPPPRGAHLQNPDSKPDPCAFLTPLRRRERRDRQEGDGAAHALPRGA
jgi:hypothetical protein